MKHPRWEIDIKLKRPPGLRISKKNLRVFAAALLDALEPKLIDQKTRELSLVFTCDSEIRNLNKLFRHKDKATDVLSFPQSKRHPAKVAALGDVVISLDTAKRQARTYRVSAAEEIARLLIHGILHLLGFDHEGVAKSKAAKMRRMERRLLIQHADLIAGLAA